MQEIKKAVDKARSEITAPNAMTRFYWDICRALLAVWAMLPRWTRRPC